MLWEGQPHEVPAKAAYHGLTRALNAAVAALGISAEDKQLFKNLVRVELRQIEPYNCARYRLPIGRTEAWIAAGRVVH
jgi:hypothetical protein